MIRASYVGILFLSAAIFSISAFAHVSGTSNALPANAKQARPKQVPLFSRDLEIEFALNALPKQLRENATVLVLEPTGWIKAREGTNAFTCLVTRQAGDVVPICWDREGAKSVMSVAMDDSTMRLKGMTDTEVNQQIAEGFKTGKYRAPTRAGVSYMLSPMRYKIDAQGKITRTPPLPHVMFYAPNLTDEDIGGGRAMPIFINNVSPQGMIIDPDTGGLFCASASRPAAISPNAAISPLSIARCAEERVALIPKGPQAATLLARRMPTSSATFLSEAISCTSPIR